MALRRMRHRPWGEEGGGGRRGGAWRERREEGEGQREKGNRWREVCLRDGARQRYPKGVLVGMIGTVRRTVGVRTAGITGHDAIGGH